MSDVGLTQIKIERCDQEIPADNKSGGKYGVKEENVGVFQSFECDGQNDEQRTGGNSDPSHKCEPCSETFATPNHLADRMKIHTEKQPEFEESSEYKFTASETDVKSEVDAVINYGEIHSEKTEGRIKIEDFELIQVKQEQTGEDVEFVNCDASDLDSPKSKIVPHKCEICNKSFAKRKYLVAHGKIHTGGQKTRKCDVCGKEYAINYLHRHMRIHTGEKPFACDVCGKAYQSKDKLKGHLDLHSGGERKYKCEVCGKLFAQRDTLRGHVRLLHSGSVSSHKCETCDKTFANRKYLLRHVKRHTAQLRKCDVCGKEFTSVNLVRHMKLHANLRPKARAPSGSHKCMTCNKSFAKKSYLAAHVKTHTGKKLCPCKICGKEYTYSYLQRHIRLHTGEKFECGICGKAFVFKQSLAHHMGLHSGVKKQYKCGVCGKIFSRRDAIASHMRLHSPRISTHNCGTCKKSFASRRYLLYHMKTHTVQAVQKCNVCGKGFTRRYLRLHMRSHTGEKQFICDICGQTFGYKNTLDRHMSKHSGGDKYECEICGKTLSRRFSIAHRRMHMGVKPHECDICRKKFSQRVQLLAHIRSHTGEKLHECE